MNQPVLLDIHATQLLQTRSRGVTRHVHSLALQLVKVAPELVGGLLVDPELALPADLGRLVSTGKLQPSDTVTWAPGMLLHLPSPYELGVPLRRLLPDEAVRQKVALVVTVHDLIPEVMPDRYFAEPGMRLRYRSRHQLIRTADAVLTVSSSARADAIERLGLEPDRVKVVYGGVDEQFVVPESRAEAAAAAVAAVPGLRPPFVLYTGGADPRKNVDGLLAAWSRLPAGLVQQHQLVLVGAGESADRERITNQARGLGIHGNLLVPGRLTDPTLILLYQGTDLFVFPSLYEGYGLPVAEALACGAPVVAAATSSLPEILEPDALFDPTDSAAVTKALDRALTDERFRRSLLARSGRAPHDWAGVARRTAEAYEAVLGAARPAAVRRARRPVAGPAAPALPCLTPLTRPARPARRPRLALVTPLPPQGGAVAAYGQRLLVELSNHADVDAFVDGPPADPAVRQPVQGPAATHPVGSLTRVEATAGQFDAVVYAFGNSPRHTGALAALRRRPGTVLAHDVRLIDVYASAPHHRPDAVPQGFHTALHTMYPNRLPADLGASGTITAEDSEFWGVLMANEVIHLSDRFMTVSPFAVALARLDARPADRHKVGWFPLALGQGGGPAQDRAPAEPPLVLTSGRAEVMRRDGLLVGALAARRPDARLASLGSCAGAAAERKEWLARATVAVVLGDTADGEVAHAIGECLAAGLPTVITGTGAVPGLPADVAVTVERDIRADDLAVLLGQLLDDAGQREDLARAALAHSGPLTFARAAEELLDLVLGPPPP